MLRLLFRAVGWACVVAIVVVSLVPGDARPDTGLPGQIDHIIAYCGTAGLLGLGYPAAKSRFGMIVNVRWLRLSEQNFRVDKWNLCRG